MKKLIAQIMKFGVVGGIAFLIDYGVLIALTELFGINYLISGAIAFTVSVIFNYLLSVFWVFEVDNSGGRQKQNFVIFIVLSVIGLGITELLMYLGTDVCHIDYRITKIGATAIVMVYNFITRKVILEKRS